MKYRLLAHCLLALIAQGAARAEDHAAKCPNQPSVVLALIDEGLPSLLEIEVAIGEEPFEEVWNHTFDTLFQFADANADGELETSELDLLPSPQSLRLALGSGFAPPVGSPVSPYDLRSESTDRITRQYVAEYYRQRGVGRVSIGVGQLKSAPVLTRALLAALDSDQDGAVSNAEWASSAKTLMKLDTNGDELVGAGEIVPNMLYPGASGTMALKSPANGSSSGSSHSQESTAVPIVLLPSDPSDERWMEELIHRGIHANADQLRKWRREDATARWRVQLKAKNAATSSFAWSSGKLHWQGWLVADSLAEPHRHAREHLMKALETDVAGAVRSSSEREPLPDWLLRTADRDRDGKVSPAEAEQWWNLQSSIVRGQVLVTLLWGGGVFEILDRNHDGALAARELRSARQALFEAGCITDDRFDIGNVPRVILAIASQGYPKTIAKLPNGSPSWARAMDRNADGDISPKEFSGPIEVLQRMDLDRDGLVDPREAAAGLGDP